jgi:thermitase
MSFSQITRLQRTLTLALGTLLTLTSMTALPAKSAPNDTLQDAASRPMASPSDHESVQDDVLLLMPDPKAPKDEITDAIKEVNGTVVGTMGSGKMQVLIIKTEKGKLAETEKKLDKSKKFPLIQRNHQYKPAFVPNDSYFRTQWHLSTIHAPQAWDLSRGRVWMSVFDSGCQSSITELKGKTEKGFDAMTKTAYANTVLSTLPSPFGLLPPTINEISNSGATTDDFGHGTIVATTAAALTDNQNAGYDGRGAGVAPSAGVYPIKITNKSTGYGDDIGIVGGLLKLMAITERVTSPVTIKLPIIGKIKVPGDPRTASPLNTPKIVNISYYVIQDFHKNRLLQTYFKAFHDTYGGIIFVSAGNDAIELAEPPVPYIQVVSAIDRSMRLADFSNSGKCVTLTAPGEDIVCTNRKGDPVSVNGTSFSSPIAASVAALVWSANPRLSNVQVESILKSTATKTKSGGFTKSYGYGMVDALAAVKRARGS